MTPDELKAIPKGSFIVMKTGFHPVQTRLRLYFDWGITFGDPYILPEKSARKVAYADKRSLTASIKNAAVKTSAKPPQEAAVDEGEYDEYPDAPYNTGGGAV